MQKRHVAIFTSVTNETLPYLAVTLKSISDFTGEGCVSDVRVLTSGLAAYNQRKLRHLSLPRVSISIVDINRRVEDYRADFEAAVPIESQIYDLPLITVEEAERKGIDVIKCCDECDVAYVA